MFNFLAKKMLKSQLKGLPEDQQTMILKAVEENPDFFKKIADQIKTKTKDGMDQQTAAMQVMMEHKDELQKIFQK